MAYAITHRSLRKPDYHRQSAHIISNRKEKRTPNTSAHSHQLQVYNPKSTSGTHPMSQDFKPAGLLKLSENVHDHISLRLRFMPHLIRIVSLLNFLERLAGVEGRTLGEKIKSDPLSSQKHKAKEKQGKIKHIHQFCYCSTWGNNPSRCMYQEPLFQPCSCLSRCIELVYNNQVFRCYIEKRMERNIHWKDIAELTCSPLTIGTNSPSPLVISPLAC
jgi:hypothetical protein